jgi:hypothetical protein
VTSEVAMQDDAVFVLDGCLADLIERLDIRVARSRPGCARRRRWPTYKPVRYGLG